jgi:hypothetical protein
MVPGAALGSLHWQCFALRPLRLAGGFLIESASGLHLLSRHGGIHLYLAYYIEFSFIWELV